MIEEAKKEIFKLMNFSLVQETCKISLENTKFFTIAGETGSGKTVALEYFYTHNREFVKYVCLRQSMTPHDFFKEVAKQFGYRYPQKKIYTTINWIRDYLEISINNYLLIIDEGGKFKPEQYGFIHELRDLTINKLGIILAGPEYFIHELNKWNEKKIKGVPEFFRRINLQVNLKDLTKDEIISVCGEYDIKSIQVIKEKFLSVKNIGDLISLIHNYQEINYKLNEGIK
ncbi:ATP-binding protein [uncultured Lacinutrix sp.]|uniref:ATP-binding protein n=1 Tax=uncultured Lacinutrix sp. TaxID=574032 RepID=UPI0026080674|nr:ATP-binding protein [uncultured Lacinutrix sp.]